MKIGTDDDETKSDAKPTATNTKATEGNEKATGETIKVAGESGDGKGDAGADTAGITGTFIVCVVTFLYYQIQNQFSILSIH